MKNSQLFHKNVERVAVAMSGGVDSSVAAMILGSAGYRAIGISMQVWDYRNNGGCKSRATCCAPDDFTDARKVAAKIGIPYYVFDFEETFRHEVIDKFVRTYARGETPNPCVDCNAKVKFFELRNRAKTFECSHVATGHYARIELRSDGYHLLRARDLAKDQSYFLYNLTQEELSQTIFPVGDFTKSEVREMAQEGGLVTASKPESQDICFVSGSVQDFLVRLGNEKKRGQIVLQNGTVIGEHEGIHSFTVGQRKGLGVGGNEEPLYVLELDAAGNRVIVGPKSALETSSFSVHEVRWSSPKILSLLTNVDGCFELSARAQVRHRHPGVPVKVKCNPATQTAEVLFLDAWATVSPGQAAVFYSDDNNELLGGGRIARDLGRFGEASLPMGSPT
jgi:tRNA-uridine 2-sulfurtransferase